MVLDEFLVKLGVISDPKDLDTFVGGLQKVATVATAAAGVVGGLTASVTKFFGDSLAGLDDLNALAQATDTELDYIQRLGYAAQMSNSSIEAANASVKGLAQTIGEAANGLGRGKQAFEAYGLSATRTDGSIKSVGEVLDEVQTKMKGLSKQQQLSLLQKLGIDQSMIHLLNDSREGMAALFREAEDLGVVTASGADAAGEFNDAMSQMDMVMSAIRTNIAVGLAPQLTNVVSRTRDWLIRNKELIREGIDRAVSVILALWRAVLRTIDVIDKVIERTIGWRAALVILSGTLAWLNRAMLAAFATNPITWVMAAIAALILLVDDLITFMEGGESMFDWSWAIPIVEELGEVIDQVGQGLREFWDNHGQHVQAGFMGLWDFVAGFFIWISNSFSAITKLLSGDWDGFLKNGNVAMDGIKRLFAGMAEMMKNQFLVLMGILGVDVEAWGDRANTVWHSVQEFFSDSAGVIASAWDGTVTSLSTAWESVRSSISGSIDTLVRNFSRAWNSVKSGFSDAMGAISKLWDKVSGSITKGLDAIGGALGWVADKLGLSSDEAGKAVGKVSGAASEAASKVSEAAATGPGVRAQIPNEYAAGAGQTGGSSSDTANTYNMTLNQKIVTDDPKAAGKYAIDEARRQQQRATTNAQGAYSH